MAAGGETAASLVEGGADVSGRPYKLLASLAVVLEHPQLPLPSPPSPPPPLAAPSAALAPGIMPGIIGWPGGSGWPSGNSAPALAAKGQEVI